MHSILYGPDGIELARARATWIAVRGWDGWHRGITVEESGEFPPDAT